MTDIPTTSASAALGGMPLLLVFFGVVAASGEYRHRTGAAAVLASGRGPGRIGLARLAAVGVVGLGLAAVTTGAAFVVGVPVLSAHQPGPDLTAAQLAGVAAGCVAAGALSVLLGAAIGELVRNQIAAVVAAVAVYFVAPSLVGSLDASSVDYTPFGAMQVLTRGVHGAAHSLPGSAAALACWVAVVSVVAVALAGRRDLP